MNKFNYKYCILRIGSIEINYDEFTKIINNLLQDNNIDSIIY